MGQLRGSLVTQWNNLYPGVPFPHPQSNPQMFPANFVLKNTTYTYYYTWWDQIWDDCCAYSRCCSKGLIDYECQFKNSCYINLINLGFHMLGFLLGAIILIILFGYAWKFSYKFIVSAAFITKFAGCLGGLLKCFTFGIFDQKVYYKHQKPKAQYTQEQKKILEQTSKIGIKITIPKLDEDQKKKIIQILKDYQIQEKQTLCCDLNQQQKK